MALLKSSLTILIVNLILIRLVLANNQASQLENINSLDFSSSGTSSSPASDPSAQHVKQQNQDELQQSSNRQYSGGNADEKAEKVSASMNANQAINEAEQITEKVGPSKPKRSRSHKSSSAVNQVIASLDKLDLKGLASGLVNTVSGILNNNNPKQSNIMNRSGNGTNSHKPSASFNSMASQLLRLARGQEHGWEYDYGATAKSDWFWLIVPAVIVVGAGVIILPLIAACFVSMFTSGSYTLSAGRKKRDVTGAENQAANGRSLLDIYKSMSGNQDFIQQLIGDLAQFDKALSSVERFIQNHSDINSKKRYKHQSSTTSQRSN